jgi:hypothetical protein
MVGNKRLYRHFKKSSFESQVHENVKKNIENNKEETKEPDIVIEPLIDALDKYIVDREDKDPGFGNLVEKFYKEIKTDIMESEKGAPTKKNTKKKNKKK